MYGLQHGALAHTEQQAINAPKLLVLNHTFANINKK